MRYDIYIYIYIYVIRRLKVKCTVMKSVRARLAAHDQVRGKQIEIWWGNMMEKDHFQDLGVDGWNIY